METPESRTDGDCFLVADRIGTRFTPDPVVDEATRRDIRVVHGLPLGTGTLNEGRRYWHAWVEVAHRTPIPPALKAANPAFEHLGEEFVTELVVDRSNGRDLVVPKAVYYNVGRLDERHVWRYTMDEASENMRRYENFGPWVDGWEDMAEV